MNMLYQVILNQAVGIKISFLLGINSSLKHQIIGW